jgi:hypothetical protein
MSNTNFITHPAVVQARKQILHLIKTGNDRNVPNIQFLVGPTGVGKSGLIDAIMDDKQFQPSEGPNGDLRPILLVEAPHKGTIKGLAEVMLRELGDPHPARGTETEMKDRIYNYLAGQETKLVIIDEVQQLSRSNRYDYAEFLKTLKNNVTCPILCVGLADALELARSNAQLKRRCRPAIELRPLDWFNAKERKIYRGILAAFRKTLAPRFNSLPIENDAIAAATHIATGGAVGGTHDFLRLCIDENDLDDVATSDQVQIKHMAMAFDGVHSGERNVFNPFTVQKLPDHWSPLPFDTGAKQNANASTAQRTRRSTSDQRKAA